MNTKIIVALVLGIALIGLTGAASAGYYHIDGSYLYADGSTNFAFANTDLDVNLSGTSVGGDYLFMHTSLENTMVANNFWSDSTSDVAFAIAQGGDSSLTVETNLPGNINTFSAEDLAFQNVDYTVNGDAYSVGFWGASVTHASVHDNPLIPGDSILPIGEMAIWDYNYGDGDAWVSTDPTGVPEATIKSGSMGYVCTATGDAVMESSNILDPVTASSGITSWSYAEGEILVPFGTISADTYGYEEVWMWWTTP